MSDLTDMPMVEDGEAPEEDRRVEEAAPEDVDAVLPCAMAPRSCPANGGRPGRNQDDDWLAPVAALAREVAAIPLEAFPGFRRAVASTPRGRSTSRRMRKRCRWVQYLITAVRRRPSVARRHHHCIAGTDCHPVAPCAPSPCRFEDPAPRGARRGLVGLGALAVEDVGDFAKKPEHLV